MTSSPLSSEMLRPVSGGEYDFNQVRAKVLWTTDDLVVWCEPGKHIQRRCPLWFFEKYARPV